MLLWETDNDNGDDENADNNDYDNNVGGIDNSLVRMMKWQWL